MPDIASLPVEVLREDSLLEESMQRGWNSLGRPQASEGILTHLEEEVALPGSQVVHEFLSLHSAPHR